MTASPLAAPLATARLRLRPLGPSDADVVQRLWAERDPRVPAHRRIDASTPKATPTGTRSAPA